MTAEVPAATTALLIGAGSGLSAALARRLATRGHRVVLAARDVDKLSALTTEIDARAIPCDAGDPTAMARLFERVDAMDAPLSVAVYNVAARPRGAVQDLDPAQVAEALMVTAFGAFLMAHHAAPRMLRAGAGMMFFTGASSGTKGFAGSSPSAMGKFALRGLCQSLARELHPQNIHVGHVLIDGGIAGTRQGEDFDTGARDDAMLDPRAVADAYVALIDQHRSAWTWEIELRPWSEAF